MEHPKNQVETHFVTKFKRPEEFKGLVCKLRILLNCQRLRFQGTKLEKTSEAPEK